MSEVIYTSTPVGDTGGVPKFNAFAFPCHEPDVEVVYLNGNYPDIESLCKAQGLTVKPFSAFKKPSKIRK
jgi:hypothetical protein